MQRMWDTLYGHSAYIQNNICSMSGISIEPYTFTQRMVHYRIGMFRTYPVQFGEL